jgi:hypothetical protein
MAQVGHAPSGAFSDHVERRRNRAILEYRLCARSPLAHAHQLWGKPGERAGLRRGNRFGCIVDKQQAFIHQP